jgi:hypothetical protein
MWRPELWDFFSVAILLVEIVAAVKPRISQLEDIDQQMHLSLRFCGSLDMSLSQSLFQPDRLEAKAPDYQLCYDVVLQSPELSQFRFQRRH